MRHESLTLQDTKFGIGVFTKQNLSKGTFLIEMTGPVLLPEEIPSVEARSIVDHYIQCSSDKFFGPSGDYDDMFNHSCEPNAGLFFENGKILVKTIKAINVAEEIYIDYSTVITIDPFIMKCSCDTPLCRGEVAAFKTLPKKIQKQYLKLGIIPDYVITSNKTLEQKKKARQHFFPIPQSQTVNA